MRSINEEQMKTIILPENKLNELAQQVSAQMLSQHTFDEDIITGDALKQFASHKQINKFLIFQVYQVWEMQMNKLKHPYFNLEHPDIASTLQVLKNQISQHIEVNSEDFRPMLERAVYNNLKLLVDPKASFQSFFFAQKEQLPLDVYQRFSQFFSDMDFIVNSILRYYQKNEIETVEKQEFFSKMEKVVEVYNRKSDKGFDAYRTELFQQISGRNLDAVVAEAAEEERIRLEKEKAEEEARRKEEEAKKLQAEKEAKLQAEEEARRLAEEEARRKEEEARRQEEEARKKAEEEAKKLSFFDTISTAGDSFFDLEDDEMDIIEVDDDNSEEIEGVDEEEEQEERIGEPEPEEASGDAEELMEEIDEEVIEEEVEEVVEEEVEEEVVEEVAEELAEEVVEEVEEKKASFMEGIESSVSDVIDDLMDEEESETEEESVEETEEDPVEELAEEVSSVVEETAKEAETAGEEASAEFDEEEFQEMAENMQPEPETAEVEEIEEAPQTILDKIGSSRETTASYLDKFLNKKANGQSKEEPTPEPEPEPKLEEPNTGETILDKLAEKPKTIAEKFQNQQPPEANPVHESINGNRKIKLDEIPIHKQYQYVQKVFDGNNVRFRIIVDKVNNAKNKAEVEDILNKFVLSNDSLDKADGVVSEFIGLLRNRF